MKATTKFIEDAKYEARGIMAEYGANKMSYMMEDMDKFITTLLTKHEEAVVERMSEIVLNSRTIEEKYGQGNRELNARVQILFDMKNKL